MTQRSILAAVIVAASLGVGVAAAPQAKPKVQPQRARPINPDEVPHRKKARPIPPRGTYVAPRTPWGDPDIAGAYDNSDESGIPLERPKEFDGRTLESFTPAELAKLTAQRQEQTIERNPTLSEFPGATSPMHWFENYFAANSRAWLISDPPDGHVPPMTDEGRQRQAALAAARNDGPRVNPEDYSLYDRCITRGVPGSMMPAIYGNSYLIEQSPGFVTITYEMVHDTRVIPLAPRHARGGPSVSRADGRPHVAPNIRQYLGDARGHWEGNALVVETTNFTDKTPYRGSSEHLKLIERFEAIGPDTVEWSVTFDDPHTWTRPWTFAMNLTHDESQPPFEYACSEGNYGLRDMLENARAEAQAAANK